MKKRILLLLMVVALIMVMLAMSAAPVFARGCPLKINHPAIDASGGRCLHVDNK